MTLDCLTLTARVQEEAQEYLQDDKLKGLVAKYSEFINVPIYLLTEKVGGGGGLVGCLGSGGVGKGGGSAWRRCNGRAWCSVAVAGV